MSGILNIWEMVDEARSKAMANNKKIYIKMSWTEERTEPIAYSVGKRGLICQLAKGMASGRIYLILYKNGAHSIIKLLREWAKVDNFEIIE